MPPRQFQMQVRAFLGFCSDTDLVSIASNQGSTPAASRRHTCWVQPYIIHHEEKGAYHNLLAELYDFDVSGFTNFMRMTPEFFLMIKTQVHPHLIGQAMNYRGPLSVGMKLAITLQFWPLGSHTSHYHTSLWLAGPQYQNLC